MHKWIVKNSLLLISVILVIAILAARSMGGSVQSISGLAVAGPSNQWTNLQDISVGTPITSGAAAVGNFLYNGTNYDVQKGDATNGAYVNVKAMVSPVGSKTPADAYANPTDALDVLTLCEVFNTSTWDKCRSAGAGNNIAGTGLPVNVPYGQFNTTLPIATTTNYGAAQTDSNFALFANTSSYKYTNVIGNAGNGFGVTGTIKSGAGWLHLVTTNGHGTAASTVVIYDNTAASGTTIGTITTVASATVTEPPRVYDIVFTTGLTLAVTGTTALDMTVSYK